MSAASVAQVRVSVADDEEELECQRQQTSADQVTQLGREGGGEVTGVRRHKWRRNCRLATV